MVEYCVRHLLCLNTGFSELKQMFFRILNKITFKNLLILFCLIFESIFLIDHCYLEDIKTKGMIQYISYAKDFDSCFLNLKNSESFYEPLTNFHANELEKEFIVDGNRQICLEFYGKDEITHLYLYMTRILNHPTVVEIIAENSDHFYQTPNLIDYQFVLLHSFYLMIIIVNLFSNFWKIPKYLYIPAYFILFIISVSAYFMIETKIKFQFFEGKLNYEIVEKL